MKTVVVPKSKFKPKVFEYLRSVESGQQELCITDHGEPVVRVISVHAAEEDDLASLRGLVLEYRDPLEPVAATWEAQS